MSVTSEKDRDLYDGLGTTGPYPITFEVTRDDGGNARDVAVLLMDSSGAETEITGSCVVSGLNVYTGEEYDSTYRVALVRRPTVTQPYTFPYGTKFPSRAFEDALDRLTFLAQRLNLDIKQSVRSAQSDDEMSRLPPAVLRANQWMAFDSIGDPMPSPGGPVGLPVSVFSQALLQLVDAEDGRLTLGVNAALIPELLYDLVIDSDEDLVTWSEAAAGEYPRVYIKAGTYYMTLSDPVRDYFIDLDAAGTTEVIAEKGATVFFNGNTDSISYRGIVDSGINKIQRRITNLTVGITNTGASTPGSVTAFDNLNNLEECWAAGEATSFTGFSGCERLLRCRMVGGGPTLAIGFSGCRYLEQCYVEAHSDTAVRAYDTCVHMTDCRADIWGDPATTPALVGANSCEQVANCMMSIAGNAAASVIGYSGGYLLTGCRFYLAGQGASSVLGFSGCTTLAACFAHFQTVTSAATEMVGFKTCEGLSSCWALLEDMDTCAHAIGFLSCVRTSACRAVIQVGVATTGGVHRGFDTCTFLTSCKSTVAANSSVTAAAFNSCENVVACLGVATNGGAGAGYMTVGCKQCQQNAPSAASKTATYNTSYADTSTNACAYTSAGGYNRVS